MVASTLVDLVKIAINSTGTGTLTLGSPLAAFRGVEALVDGATYSYSIQQFGNYEIGTGVYSATPSTLTRGIQHSSNGGTAINLSANAVLTVTVLATDYTAINDAAIASVGAAAAAAVTLINSAGATQVGAVNNAGTTNVAAVNSALTAALAAITTAQAVAIAAVAASGLAGANAAAALAGYVPSDITVGTVPVSGTDLALAGAIVFSNFAVTADGQLDWFTVRASFVGNGLATGAVALRYLGPSGAGTGCMVLNKFPFTVAATGNKTYYAGVDFPRGVILPQGAIIGFGNTNGSGPRFEAVTNAGQQVSIATSTAGYNSSMTTGGNYQVQVQFGIAQQSAGLVKDAVSDAVSRATVQPADGVTTHYVGSDEVIFTSIGADGYSNPSGNGFVQYEDGMVIGAQYCADVAGVGYFIQYRGAAGSQQAVGFWREPAIAVGDRLTSVNPTPFFGKAGDQLTWAPVTAAVKRQNLTYPSGTLPSNMNTTGGASFDAFGQMRAFRSMVTRPRTAKRVAHKATRGSTVVLESRFRGTSNPTGWAANAGKAFTVNDSLLMPASGTGAGWDCWYRHNQPTNAQRRVIEFEYFTGNNVNVAGPCSFQQTSGGGVYGSAIHIDGPNALLRAYAWSGSGTPGDAGMSVALPWTPAAGGDHLKGTIEIERGRMTVTVTNPQVTAAAAVLVSNWQFGGAIGYAGIMSGNLGFMLLSGTGGGSLQHIRNSTLWDKSPGGKIWCGDSTHHMGGGTGDNYDRVWVHQVEDMRGKGNFINVARAAATATQMYAAMPLDFTALVGSSAADIEVFWAPGVNPDNNGGSTDAIRYGNYKTATQAAAALVTGLGGKFTIVTPTPSIAAPTYVAYLINKLLTGDLGDYDVIDVNFAVAAAGNRGAWANQNYAWDLLHPSIQIGSGSTSPSGADIVRASFLAQRPDMA